MTVFLKYFGILFVFADILVDHSNGVEGDSDVLFDKSILDIFDERGADLPIIRGLCPYANHSINRGRIKIPNANKGSGVFKDALVVQNSIVDSFLCLSCIGIIGYGNGQVKTAGGFGGIVGNSLARKISVRNANELICGGLKSGVSQADLYDLALTAGGGDPMSCKEGLGYHNEDTAGNVGYNALYRQRKSKTEGAKQSYK